MPIHNNLRSLSGQILLRRSTCMTCSHHDSMLRLRALSFFEPLWGMASRCKYLLELLITETGRPSTVSQCSTRRLSFSATPIDDGPHAIEACGDDYHLKSTTFDHRSVLHECEITNTLLTFRNSQHAKIPSLEVYIRASHQLSNHWCSLPSHFPPALSISTPCAQTRTVLLMSSST